MKKTLTLDRFTILIDPPVNRNSLLCLAFYENGNCNMNGRLTKELGGRYYELRFTGDAKNLAFIPADQNARSINFPKNGRRNLPEAVEFLVRMKVALPAQYEMWFNEKEGFWQGDLLANPSQAPSKKPLP